MKQIKSKLAILILILLVITGCSCEKEPQSPNNTIETPTTPGNEKNEQPIIFSEPIFEELLKKELKKETIYPKDLEIFTNMIIGGDHFISLSGNGIPEKSIVLLFGTEVEIEGQRYKGYGKMKSLADLASFPNLTQLQVTLQPEMDYQTIPSEVLSKLRSVHISQSKLTEIDFLQGATQLISLSLSINDITDLSPLKDLSELMYVSASGNKVADLSPLSNLKKLKRISFYENQISDLSPLKSLENLEALELYNNQVKDLSPLTNLKSLKVLELINNKVEDVSPLKGFESFESLRLSGNPITNIEELNHIKNLDFQR